MMGISAFIRGVAEGYAGAGVSPLVKRLCQANRWAIDEQNGRRATLYFNGDAVTARRHVNVLHAAGEPVMSFFSISRAIYPAHSVPDELVTILLARNSLLGLSAWHVTMDDDDDALFVLQYTAPAGGVDPAFFRTVCIKTVEEVAWFEGMLRGKGLL